MEQEQFTVTVFSEDNIGLLNRITDIFTRRKINIDSLTTSASETEGIFRFTVVISTTLANVKRIVKQLEKQVEVLKAFYYDEEDIIFQEVALYKISTQALAQSKAVEKIIRANYARILTVEPEFMVIEKTGHESETQDLFEQLKPYGILSFVRSGRVAIAKPMKRLSSYLAELGQTL
ncbi:acetolactate synthase small subunit [Microscilla marina]|uniref:Acetolactate synthase small subunit n=1 Tax=Microscilla marina ATCC 23134 TaxID=313606 RepID=A1ZNB5_MICM2|nr:acetolactate synthase small subunit [Microscilla marina]EAY28026.1 acetolactate synthase, small subunit [Microscilla marina ATCC 23134]